MDPKTKWLMRQPSYWVGMVVTAALAALAVGLIPQTGNIPKLVAAFLMIAHQYGVTAAHLASPPRIPYTNEQRIALGLQPLPAVAVAAVNAISDAPALPPPPLPPPKAGEG